MVKLLELLKLWKYSGCIDRIIKLLDLIYFLRMVILFVFVVKIKGSILDIIFILFYISILNF